MQHEHEFVKEDTYYYDGARKLKYRCACGAKTFKWQKLLSANVWVSGRKGDPGLFAVRHVPNGRTWVVEGERDVIAMDAVGELAVSPPDGAGSWQDHYGDEVAGLGRVPVIIVADADNAGRKHAAAVRASLLRSYPGLDVSVVEPPAGKDVAEFLAKGGSVDDLAPRVTRSLTEGITIPGLKLREGDPVYRGGYAGPSEWLGVARVAACDARVEPRVRVGSPVAPYDVRVRCGGCDGYLMVSLDDGLTRKCWRCRTKVETNDGVVYKPLIYRCEVAND